MTTCQICGRSIKTVVARFTAGAAFVPVIAHHGFKRPNHGWQTSSCFGARYRPYEIACDAFAPAIAQLERWKEREETAARDLRASPPAVMVEVRNRRPINHDRPEGFNPAVGDFSTYGRVYRAQIERHCRNAQEMSRDLGELRQRLAAWKPAGEVSS